MSRYLILSSVLRYVLSSTLCWRASRITVTKFLTDAERACNDQFTPCCSRAKGGCLVLDL